jgi:hypothetical protein
MDGFVLGCRIRDVADGTRGTVKYIGPVAAAKNKSELWLGVEWDSTGRGKHDGSCLDEVAKTSDECCECFPQGCKEGFKILIEANMIGHLSQLFFLNHRPGFYIGTFNVTWEMDPLLKGTKLPVGGC